MKLTCLKSLCSECYLEDHLGHPKINLKNFSKFTKKLVDDGIESLDKKVSELEASKANHGYILSQHPQPFLWYAELLEEAALAERKRVLLRSQEHNEF